MVGDTSTTDPRAPAVAAAAAASVGRARSRGIYGAAMDIWAAVADERRALADQLDTLTSPQWATPSLCSAWTVRDVAAHLVVPQKIGIPRFAVTLLRARGSFPRANVAMTAWQARRPPAELVADIRASADSRRTPPGLGAVAPLTDVLVHSLDIRVPLGLADDRPAQPWGPALDFLVSSSARRGFVGKRLPELSYAATDLDWSHGTGPEVRGPAAALGLAILGRPARLSRLSGPGAAELAAWIGD